MNENKYHGIARKKRGMFICGNGKQKENLKQLIVIVHSAYEHHRRYAWLIEKLRSSNCHIVMGDLPGHGELKKSKTIHDESFDHYKELH